MMDVCHGNPQEFRPRLPEPVDVKESPEPRNRPPKEIQVRMKRFPVLPVRMGHFHPVKHPETL
jgi:hypothetical protein